jgi:hypothetical protein
MSTRQRRALAEQRRTQQIRQQRYRLIGIGIVAAVVLAVILIMASGQLAPAASSPVAQVAKDTALCQPIQSFPTQSRDHIAPGQPHPPYSSNPPTSGWHWANPQDWGAYQTPQVQEQLVHNLEHGGIVIQYNDLSGDETQQLIDLFKQDSYHLILAPYPGLPSNVRVALTAWDHLQTCTGVDPSAIRAFINAFRNKGPELVP